MIRKAEPKDNEKIAQLWYDINLATHDFISQEYWLEQLPKVKEAFKTAEIYVYQKDDKILGFIGLEDNYIAGIFVASTKQSSGIGQKLLSHVKNLKDTLTLKVYQKNQCAISFYQKNGFEIKGESIDETNKEDEYVMEWRK